MKRPRYMKAQSTLEYIVILTAVIGVILWAARGLMKPAVTTSITDAGTTIDRAAKEFSSQ